MGLTSEVASILANLSSLTSGEQTPDNALLGSSLSFASMALLEELSQWENTTKGVTDSDGVSPESASYISQGYQNGFRIQGVSERFISLVSIAGIEALINQLAAIRGYFPELILDVLTGPGFGIMVKDGPGSIVMRTLQGPAAGISVADGTGISADPTISLANDLAALEGLASTGVPYRTGADTYIQKSYSELLDGIGSTRGSVLYRGAAGWAILTPGTSTHVLTSNGAGADPSYQVTASGTAIFTSRTTQAVTAGVAISTTDGEPITPITISGDVTMTAAPTIAAGRNGQLCIIVNDDATSTDDLVLSDAGVLSGSLLRLGASTRTLTPGATLTLAYNSVIGAWVEINFNTLVTITPVILTHTINIGAGAASSQNAEVASSGTHTPTFAWTYTGVPSAGTVDVSVGGDAGTDYPATISTPFTSLTAAGFNKGTSVGTVRTFTPSITVNGSVLTSPTATVTYINRRYAGPNTQSSALSSAQVLALDGAGGTSDLSTSQYGTFVVSTTTSEYIWFAHRSALTAISSDGMSIEGEIAGFTDIGTISHTNDSGFVETFRLYRTTNTNFGSSKSLVTASSRRNNRIYMGPSSDTDPISNANILALDDTVDGESIVSSTVARTYTDIKIESGEYLWFCHPDAISDLATIKDGTTGFAIAGSYRSDVSHTNQYGYVESYRCWRSDNTNIYPSGEDIVVT